MSSRLKAAMQQDIEYNMPRIPRTYLVTPPPFVMTNVPTTLSAGEYSPKKSSYFNVDIVILDPEWIWMSSGVRSIDHCVEQD